MLHIYYIILYYMYIIRIICIKDTALPSFARITKSETQRERETEKEREGVIECGRKSTVKQKCRPQKLLSLGLLHTYYLTHYFIHIFSLSISLALCLSSVLFCTLSSLKITTHLKNLLTYASFNQIKSKHESKLPTLCSEY